jgi:opacity protein-like surface antigen
MTTHASLPKRLLLAGALILALAPTPAFADGWIIPFAGVNFSGNSGNALADAADASRLNWGASLGAMAAGIFGVEGDFGFSPDFYGKNDVGGSNVLTAMGNLVVGVPLGGQHGFGVRPYGLFGLGLMKSSVDTVADVAKVQANDFGWSFGGGVMVFFSSHLGVRGDLRYFRTFGDTALGQFDLSKEDQPVHFARGSAGLILRF